MSGPSWDEVAIPAAEARAWIATTMPGLPRVEGPTVIYNRKEWGVVAGFVLHLADSTVEEVVFKTCYLPEFAASGRLGEVLARHCPSHVPHLLARGRRGDYTLTLFRPFTGHSALDSNSLESMLAMVRTFASIQATIAAIPADELDALPRVPLTTIPGLLDNLMAAITDRYLGWWHQDDRALMTRHGIPNDIIERLNAYRLHVRAWADELAAGGWPESVDHVDLLPHNAIIQPDGGVLIYDWEQAEFGCPFLSVDVLLLAAQQIGGNPADAYALEAERDTAATRAVRAAYLDALPWGGRDERERAFDLALCLAPLRYAESEGWLARRVGHERALAASQAWWTMRALRRWERMNVATG